jgi:hypothetical protein
MHQELCINPSGNSNLEKLRVFLFRFISDYAVKADIQEREHIITVVLKLNDSRLFDDGEGNYEVSIFEEME